MRRRAGVPLLTLAVLSIILGAGARTADAAKPVEGKYTEALFLLHHPKGLQNFVRSVSDPESSRYRHYRPVEWLVRKYGPTRKTKAAALAWLSDRGIDGEYSPLGGYITASLTKEQMSSLVPVGASASSLADGGEGQAPPGLSSSVSEVGFSSGDRIFSNALKSPQITSALAAKKPNYGSGMPHSGTSKGCHAGVSGNAPPTYAPFTPNQYLDAYGITKLNKSGFRGQGMSAAVVEIDGFKRRDLERFGSCFGRHIPPTPVRTVGLKKPLKPGAESTLDLEIMSAAAPKLDRISVYEGGASEFKVMNTIGAALGTPGDRPGVISISLGACEQEIYGAAASRRGIGNIFAVAAGTGISVFVSSGDQGSSACVANHGATLPLLSVSDPASSKFATSVGGTNFKLNRKNQIRSEITWNNAPAFLASGGGGLSILATRVPWWEQAKPFNKFGLTRTVPDISALADTVPGYSLYCTVAPDCTSKEQPKGGFVSFGGTSAASPLMAAGFALLNQKARAAGNNPLGFLNPLIYNLGLSPSRKDVFRDVTSGNNDVGKLIPASAGGGTKSGCCSAHPGYDLATGWGSPKLPQLGAAATKFLAPRP